MRTPRVWRAEEQANTTDAGPAGNSQSDAKLTSVADGSYYVVWTDASGFYNGGVSSSVIARRFDINGNAITGEINLAPGGLATHSAEIAALPNNGLVVTYLEQLSSTNNDVYASVAGSSAKIAIENSTDRSKNPAVTAFADGSFVVAYTVDRPTTSGSTTFFFGFESDIVARYISASGAIGPLFNIYDAAFNNLGDNAHLATLNNGNFVVAYSARHTDVRGRTSTDAVVKIFSPDGTLVASDTLVNSVTFSLSSTVTPQTDIAALRSGGFVAVWSRRDSFEDSVANIHAAIYSAEGVLVRPDFIVNTSTDGAQHEPHVTALDDGGFMVSWEDDQAGAERAQRFNAAGNAVGAEIIIKTGFVGETDITTLSNGRVAFAFDDASTGDPDVTHSIWETRHLPRHHLASDFNPDNTDIVWQRDDGMLMNFHMSGAMIASAAVAASIAPAWEIASTGDYNGDRATDALFRRIDGSLLLAELANNQVQTQTILGQVGLEWQVLGSSDFNGDTRDDILWQRNDGTLLVFDMNGSQIMAAPIVGQIGAEWSLQGTGDYNGDGTGDMLWRRGDGAVLMFEIANNLVQNAIVFGQVGNEWRAVGSGDFNGDHKTDVLWRHDDGTLIIHDMNGAQVTSSTIAGQIGNEWVLQGTADYNSDGTADLLWRRSNDGALVLFEMMNNQLQQATLFGQVGLEWDIL